MKVSKKTAKVLNTISLALFISVGAMIYAFYESEPPLDMTTAAIEQAYIDIKANDNRARSVFIDTDAKRLIIARNIVSKTGQNEQAQSWCSSYPGIKWVNIVDLKSDVMGAANCPTK